MRPTRRRAFAPRHTLVLICVAALASLVASGCARPKKGNERFVGTFKWQQAFGSQSIALERGGKAKYLSAMAGEGANDAQVTKERPATYGVLGDTAYLLVEWPDERSRGDTLFLLLRGDSLIMLNSVLGGNPVFMRMD
jgi:hypothetical protein